MPSQWTQPTTARKNPCNIKQSSDGIPHRDIRSIGLGWGCHYSCQLHSFTMFLTLNTWGSLCNHTFPRTQQIWVPRILHCACSYFVLPTVQCCSYSLLNDTSNIHLIIIIVIVILLTPACRDHLGRSAHWCGSRAGTRTHPTSAWHTPLTADCQTGRMQFLQRHTHNLDMSISP